MLLNVLEYHWAEQLDEALMLLSRPDVKTVPLAGGTYLVGHRDDSIQAVVDLRDLELSYVTEDARSIHIGAMTTLQSMVESPVLRQFASGILARSAQVSSFSRLIRNAATIGGTLGTGANSQADLLTTLAVLDAEIMVRSGSKTQVNLGGGTLERPGLALSGVTFKGKQERRIPFHSLFLDRRPNELILEVSIPRREAGSGTAFARVGRTPTDVALLNVAASVQVADGAYHNVRLALCGVNMEPQRLYAIERQLEGLSVPDNSSWASRITPILQSGMSEFRPSSDFRASAAYRRTSGLSLVFHALDDATRIARTNGMNTSEGGK